MRIVRVIPRHQHHSRSSNSWLAGNTPWAAASLLPGLFIAVAEAAEERGAAVATPLVLIGAGLPILPGLAGESKSYAERLFNFPDIGPLAEPDAIKALREPIEAAGESIEPAALREIYRLTSGYPYFLQEWGYQAWSHATASPITLRDVLETTEIVTKRLDESFFRVRFDRLTPREKKYLRAMANLGRGPYRSSDIAEALEANIKTLGPLRASLIPLRQNSCHCFL